MAYANNGLGCAEEADGMIAQRIYSLAEPLLAQRTIKSAQVGLALMAVAKSRPSPSSFFLSTE